MPPRWAEVSRLVAAVAAVLGVSWLYSALHITNATTVALTFLLIVLVAATTSRLWLALVTSVVSMLSFNYNFLPPVGTWTISDPQNWVALGAFLAVSLIASNLSLRARARTQEALSRRDELARLFDLSRDVLLTTEGREAMAGLARSVARRFDLAYVGIALPKGASWEVVEAGPLTIALDLHQLSLAFAGAQSRVEFDARSRTYAGHREMMAGDQAVRLVPLRVGVKPIGLLAAAGRPVEVGTLDALAAIVAIAVERASLLDERKAAELARRGEELKTALLGSLAHDLRTPLTAIRVAASNIQASGPDPDGLKEQSGLILEEAERLGRLFEDILEMARIDTGSVPAERRWTHPSEIVDAARDHAGRALAGHALAINVSGDALVHIDPRLTASALAHVIENATQYAPVGSSIEVSASVDDDGLTIAVRDHGPGIAPADLPRLFERFYRGASTKAHSSGTGMGLSIARGLLAAEHGRIWAENAPGGGAQFMIVVPAERKLMEAASPLS